MQPAGQLSTDSTHSSRYGWGAALLVAAFTFLAILPTLSWFEFSSGSENLNAATVLEMHREGRWLMPTLNNQPRLAKPPLTAWTSATLIPPSSLTNLDSPDRATRDRAYDRLALLLRWPSLVLACAVVLGTYWLGRETESPQFGWCAAIVCASCLLFLRFARSATTDVQLACWVALANALFASAVFSGVRVWKLLGIAVALGLSVLAKGPVGLLQTCVPWLVFALLDRPSRSAFFARPARHSTMIAIIAIICLALSVPWFAWVLLQHAQASSIWWNEVTREGATTLERDAWYSYVSVFLAAMPWTAFFIAGLATAFSERSTRTAKLTLSLLIVPILLMSLAKDKNDRYLVPLLPAVSMLTAMALRAQFRAASDQSTLDKWLRAIQWILIIAAMIGTPIVALAQLGGTSTYSQGGAVILLIGFVALLGVLLLWSRRNTSVVVPATLIAMLAVHAALAWGYRDLGGRSELKPVADVIRKHAPNASIWFYDPPEHTKIVPADLSIYLNRIVRTARDEPTIQSASPGDVVVMLQRKGTPQPTIAGWTPLGKGGVNGRYWWALQRERATTQP